MIKLTKHIRINALTIFMFASSFIFGYERELCVTYAVMLLHEAAHLAAACCIGLRTDVIVFAPFGVNLRLKNKMVYSVADEIILYISGPLVNASAAVISAIIYERLPSEPLRQFYLVNIALFLMNMLPAPPLDGGVIFRNLLSRVMGFKAAYRVCACVSALLCIFMLACGAYAAYVSRRNFSLLLFSFLLIGNLLTQKEKYSAELANDLVLRQRKRTRRVRHIVAYEGEDSRDIAARFNRSANTFVYVLDKNGSVKDVLSEKQVMKLAADASNITIP